MRREIETRRVVWALVAAVVILAGPAPAQAQRGPSAKTAHDFAVALARDGARPAASAAERRAHAAVTERFRGAGLRLGLETFRVPGKGTSRDVLGIRDVDASCLYVVMAHADSVPPAAGANDNASGVGALVALGDWLGGDAAQPPCDVWLVATGAEERPYTGHPDHLGALALARRLKRLGRAADVRFALSLDEVGRGSAFHLRSPVPSPRAGVERALLSAARSAKVDIDWVRDSGTGNSDHREIELAGMPGMKLGVRGDDPCRHTVCDAPGRLQRAAVGRVLRVVSRLLTRS